MTSVRMRGTFMKIGQSLLVRRQLELEKQLKEKMIHSVIPRKVAAWLMSEAGSKVNKKGDCCDNHGTNENDASDGNDCNDDDDDEVEECNDSETNESSDYDEERIPFTAKNDDIRSLFRPFNMHRMENVSILFADIVGFTKMSSNKTASELVAILNELFERFDELCQNNFCEKISTLGDCYYCVSGCPEPRPDHAICCVEMGLSMIKAIADFEKVSNEGINMRVGIHTGTVLCGILGTKRVKFDVWSNDVSLANRMESTGKPGQIHLSDATKQFLNDRYALVEGEIVNGLKTYFVVSRKEDNDCGMNAIEGFHSSPDIVTDFNISSINNTFTSVTADACSSSFPYQMRTVPSSPVEIKKSTNNSRNFNTNDENNSGKIFQQYLIDSERRSLLSNNKLRKTSSCSGFINKIITANSNNDVCRKCNPTNNNNDNENNVSSHSLPAIFNLNENITSHCSIDLFKYNTTGNKKRKRFFEPYQQSSFVTTTTDITITNATSFTTTNDTVTSVSACANTVSTIATSVTTSLPSYTTLSPDVKLRLLESSAHSKAGLASKKKTGCICANLRQQKPFQSHQAQQQQSQLYQHPRPPLSPADETSVCLSMNSRKDSGIRSSSSRRSSIQQQLYGFMQGEQLISRRVSLSQSGYYTSSQFTINEDSANGDNDNTVIGDNPEGCSDVACEGSKHLAVCLQKLRKQSDLQLIRCVQDNRVSQRSYFVDPPLSKFTLFFKQNKLEKEYRKKVHRHNTVSYKHNDGTKIDCGVEGCKDRSLAKEEMMSPATTLATARVNTYLDITISFLVFVLAAVIVTMSFPIKILQIIVFIFLSFIYVLTIGICFYNVKYPVKLRWSNKLLDWYPWHTVGAILVSMPIVLIIFNYIESIRAMSSNRIEAIYQFTSLVFIGLIHFCNFTQLNCWMKNFLASLFSFFYIILIMSYISVDNENNRSDKLKIVDVNRITNDSNVPSANYGLYDSSSFVNNVSYLERNCTISNEVLKFNKTSYDNITGGLNSSVLPRCESSELNLMNMNLLIGDDKIVYKRNKVEQFVIEIWLDTILLLLLIWLLNREFEISYRLSFHSDTLATRDKRKIQLMKEQADCLLHNIIPQHVAEHLKNTARYSETVKNAGIIFASITNFSEMYDESYLGGRECLRVLNELVSDFDELLNHEQFSLVEKIKTIGSTYMAASGLTGGVSSEHSHHHHHHGHTSSNSEDLHLFQLMEFALALQEVVNTFNSHLLEFNLILRIGFNCGDIVAGVIGTSKLHYDIWGDAVNIASRMDSTGVSGKIQVPSECLHFLTRWYRFAPRGSVYVKGKDHMNTYLLSSRKDDVSTLLVKPTS